MSRTDTADPQKRARLAGVRVAYLGRLVDAEVERRQHRVVAGVSPDLDEADQALVARAEVRASVDELDSIAGRLARSATAHEASWEDVGSSLRVGADQARCAYQPGS